MHCEINVKKKNKKYMFPNNDNGSDHHGDLNNFMKLKVLP